MYLKDYSSRKYMVMGMFILVALIYIIRLFYLQVIDNQYKLSAENIVLRYEKQYPARGNIYDRNGNLLVYNEALYDLMVIPGQVKNIDTATFCDLLQMDRLEFVQSLNRAKKYSYYKPSVFVKQISKKDFGVIQEKLYQFSGFYSSTRTLRRYPFPIAAHLLGNVGEVSQYEIDRDAYYQSGDYIGKSGIEKYYENELRGIKGMKVLEVDVHNRVKGSYQEGKYDTLAIPGNDLILSIDANLQLYGEQLMQNKKGSIVAIDPKSGEILALVSSPGFDPNMLVGRERSENFNFLLEDTLKPLLNRAVMGTYPPGSTFKMINALVALQEGAVTPNTSFTCQGKSSRPIKCTHDHKSPLQLEHAIQESCNPYFWNTFKSILNAPKYNDPKKGYEQWYQSIRSFGFGEKFNTDIPFELSGNIPTRAYYDKLYNGSWNALTVRSLSIGQGEILVTPIQLANLVAIIANKGYYYAPHFLRKIESEAFDSSAVRKKYKTSVDAKHFDFVTGAMLQVFEGDHGTARYYKMDSIQQCGKTGTVQNPHGEDHSMFIAFAPLENPKIAIAVIVENSGYGSTWAAPIASLLMEKYLTGKVKRTFYEKKMLEGDLIHGIND
ncbi:MAG: penicillin-binding protein 2 [Bacteroidetes bacterium]|nr:penicillin-binding protein 2 [Bacteroidota bacterium]